MRQLTILTHQHGLLRGNAAQGLLPVGSLHVDCLSRTDSDRSSSEFGLASRYRALAPTNQGRLIGRHSAGNAGWVMARSPSASTPTSF
jgi:hypothetical protein